MPASEAERQWGIKTCPKGEVVETTYMVVVFKKKEKKITLQMDRNLGGYWYRKKIL